MNKVLLIIFIIMLTLGLCSCKHMDIAESENKDAIFQVVETYFGSRILVDTETKVMYWESHENELTPLFNSDGTLKTLDE